MTTNKINKTIARNLKKMVLLERQMKDETRDDWHLIVLKYERIKDDTTRLIKQLPQ